MSGLGLLAQMLGSLAVVVGLLLAASRLLRGPLARGARLRGQPMEVLARTALSRTASLAVVRVADRALVVGVSEGEVRLLTETDPAAFATPIPAEPREPRWPARTPTTASEPGQSATAAPPAGTFASALLHALRERTVRGA